MSFTVVIPVLNEVVSLPELLGDIHGQTLKPMQTVVGDCGSTDGSLVLLKGSYPQVVITHARHKSPACARNIGVSSVESEYIIFIDADIRLPENFCRGLLDSHIQTNSDITYPKFLSDGKSLMGAVHVGYVRMWLRFWRIVKPEKGIGGVLCINRHVFESLGRFNEAMLKGEDVDLYTSASKAGYKINYCESVQCYVSSRRTKGFGIIRTILVDGPILSKLNKNKRDYQSYK